MVLFSRIFGTNQGCLVVWNHGILWLSIQLGIVTPTNVHIFQRSRYTTNQKTSCRFVAPFLWRCLHVWRLLLQMFEVFEAVQRCPCGWQSRVVPNRSSLHVSWMVTCLGVLESYDGSGYVGRRCCLIWWRRLKIVVPWVYFDHGSSMVKWCIWHQDFYLGLESIHTTWTTIPTFNIYIYIIYICIYVYIYNLIQVPENLKVSEKTKNE